MPNEVIIVKDGEFRLYKTVGNIMVVNDVKINEAKVMQNIDARELGDKKMDRIVNFKTFAWLGTTEKCPCCGMVLRVFEEVSR